jgi:hypothetical protein
MDSDDRHQWLLFFLNMRITDIEWCFPLLGNRAMVLPNSSYEKALSVSSCPSMRRMVAGCYGVLPYYAWEWIVGVGSI